MKYRVMRTDGSYLDNPYFSKIIHTFEKGQMIVEVLTATIIIKGSYTNDGITTIRVEVK